MPRVFKRIQKLDFYYDNEIPHFLRTHPTSSARIAEAQNRLNQYPKRTTSFQNNFKLIQVRTEVLTSNDSAKTVRLFKTKFNSTKQKNNKYLLYGYALALDKNLQPGAALNIASSLKKDFPDELLFNMLTAKLTASEKKYDDALNILKSSLKNYEHYNPLILQYAETLIAARKFQEAQNFIRRKIRQKTEEDARLYRLLSQAYAGNHKIADAYQAKAKAYEIDGYNRQAALLLKQALKIPKLSTTNRAIINARLDHIKKIALPR